MGMFMNVNDGKTFLNFKCVHNFMRDVVKRFNNSQN